MNLKRDIMNNRMNNRINIVAKTLGLMLNIGEGQTPKYRTATAQSEKFGTLEIVFDWQFDTKRIELFVPLDKSEDFKDLLNNIDKGYKHKMNGLLFEFEEEKNIIEKVQYYIKKLK